MLVLGDKEVEEGTVNVRTREGANLGSMPVDAFITLLNDAVAQKGNYVAKTAEKAEK